MGLMYVVSLRIVSIYWLPELQQTTSLHRISHSNEQARFKNTSLVESPNEITRLDGRWRVFAICLSGLAHIRLADTNSNLV